jgi:hypothetical protein
MLRHHSRIHLLSSRGTWELDCYISERLGY